MATLQTAREHYRRQQETTVKGVLAARRARRSGRESRVIATLVASQTAAVGEAQASVPAMLEEQGINAPPSAALVASSLLGWSMGGNPLVESVRAVWDATQAVFDRMVATELQDVARVAAGIETTVRPRVGGHVRYLNLPSCGDCTVLAGKWYRWSDGFLRHPFCDCQMLPTNEDPASELVSDPMEAFRSGQVTGLSKAEVQAVEDGADLSQVVNVRSKKAGLKVAGRVLTRGGRLTPEGIYQRAAGDRDEALRLLAEHGYIR